MGKQQEGGSRTLEQVLAFGDALLHRERSSEGVVFLHLGPDSKSMRRRERDWTLGDSRESYFHDHKFQDGQKHCLQ